MGYKNYFDGHLNLDEETQCTLLPFWQSLISHANFLKSIPFESYDFYHDCIIRHLDTNTIAFIGDEKWTYDEIHQLVCSQLPIWNAQELSPGQTVALVLPQGIDFLVALMTALYIGLNISIFLMDDPYLPLKKIQKELDKLKPDAIITLSSHTHLGPNIIEWNLVLKSETDLTIPSHSYLPGNPLFSSVSTDAAFLYPLRDALLTLPLKTGTIWARPLFSPMHDEPFASLTALLAGATLFHIDNSTLLAEPASLKNAPIEILGVSHRLLELWSKTPGCPSNLRFWYKSPLLGHLTAWNRFTEINDLKKIPFSNIYIESTNGGIILTSQPKPYTEQSLLTLPLGIPSKLLELNNSGEKALEGVGYFNLQPKLILGQVQDHYVISYSTHPIQKGTFYPFKEVEQCINSLKFISECMIISERNPKDLVGSFITLLIFITPENQPAKPPDWEEQVNQTLKEEVGTPFFPDRILSFSIYPNRINGKLNRNWVIGQYYSGLLHKKEKNTLFQKLTAFKYSIYQTLVGI